MVGTGSSVCHALSETVLRRIDPFYHILHLVLRGLLTSGLTKPELAFVQDNLNKHRKVLWIDFFSTFGVLFGLRGATAEELGIVITALLAPVMVMGAAWFAISFGGIPGKLIDTAMTVTFWMFTAFAVSFSAMAVAVMMVSPIPVWPALVLIFGAALVSCILYDTMDGLKVGLD
ncbi:MAG: hypothetical protein UY95_C0037G0004 [Parcubacteria group bacterium GW2011_GWA2_56_7]|nr:MAG: hypothetical protein UY95_C0037G0004 [Parcubacteria group bacterium GW2011_GWA2_56_7]